jgi:hypothetical protein
VGERGGDGFRRGESSEESESNLTGERVAAGGGGIRPCGWTGDFWDFGGGAASVNLVVEVAGAGPGGFEGGVAALSVAEERPKTLG